MYANTYCVHCTRWTYTVLLLWAELWGEGLKWFVVLFSLFSAFSKFKKVLYRYGGYIRYIHTYIHTYIYFSNQTGTAGFI